MKALISTLLVMIILLQATASGFDLEVDVVKDNILRESAEISDIGMAAAREMLLRSYEENITEADVVRYIEEKMIAQGSSEYIEAFGVMVSSGVDSSLPHGDYSNDDTNQILPGEVVVVDLGARYRGYCTDITRTFFMGEPTQEMKDIYNITLEAQEKAIQGIRTGKKASEIDKIARDIITENGYGENFTHGLGHGIGVYIHMPPTLAPSSNGILVKASDMAITIEPGIYLPDRWGVRIEDDVLVTWISYEVITHTPKDLEYATLLPESNNTAGSMDDLIETRDPNGSVPLLLIIAIGSAGVMLMAVAVYRKFRTTKD